MACGQYPVNVPLEISDCYERTVTLSRTCDYLFLSADQTFTLEPVLDVPFCWSVDLYHFPIHQDAFLNDIRKMGIDVDEVGDDVIIRNTSIDFSATSLSSYFSAISCVAAHSETQEIKGYTTPFGQRFWINLNTGEKYEIVQSDWVNVPCSELSATSPGGAAGITTGTMNLSGGYFVLTASQSFTVPGGIYHSVEFVLLSGAGTLAINGAYRLSTDTTVGQRTKSYQSSQYGTVNLFLPALTVSAVSGTNLFQWDGLYP